MESLNVREILRFFKVLEKEDPALNVVWEEKLQEIQVHIMGIIQIEVLKQLVKERFNLTVDFGPCEVLYKETILVAVAGCGHFEPLRHYAEVHLKLEPGERNSGIIFKNRMSILTICRLEIKILYALIFLKGNIMEYLQVRK